MMATNEVGPLIDTLSGLANKAHSGSQSRSATQEIISVAMIDEKKLTRECISRCLKMLERFEVVAFATCEEYLRERLENDILLYHSHEDVALLRNKEPFNTLKHLYSMLPVVILADFFCPNESLLTIYEDGVRGFIPTVSTTLKQLVQILEFVVVGGVFVPLDSLSLQRLGKRHVTAELSNNQFTQTQLAVLDRLKQGKANKIIAHELNVSESTVKVHIGKIMRKLKATNRTQVVSQAYALATTNITWTPIVIQPEAVVKV